MYLIWIKLYFYQSIPSWPHLCYRHQIISADITVSNDQLYPPLGPHLNSFILKKENIGSGHYIIWTGPIEPTLLINNKTKRLLDANISSQLLITIKLEIMLADQKAAKEIF